MLPILLKVFLFFVMRHIYPIILLVLSLFLPSISFAAGMQADQSQQQPYFASSMKQDDINNFFDQLANEYQSVSDFFITQGNSEAASYFASKAGQARLSYMPMLEDLPDEIKQTSEGFKLVRAQPIVIGFLRNDKLMPRYSSIVAKSYSLYDCAVGEMIQSSVTGVLSSKCYEDFFASVTLAQNKVKDIQGDKTLENAKGLEKVNKVFTMVEFEHSSYTVDISNLDKFKEIAGVLSAYGDYMVTIVGYRLAPEVNPKDTKSPNAAMNNLTKMRVLGVRKALVSQGVDKDKIKIAHPEESKVKFLYNLSGDISDIVIVDLDVKK